MNCRQLAVAALLIVSMTCFGVERESEGRLLFGVLGNEPFTIQEKGKPPSGLYVELLETIIEHAKVDAEIQIYPLARVHAQLKIGEIAATLAISSPNILGISVPVAEVMQLESIVVGPKGTSIRSFDDLQGKNVCMIRGASFASQLHEDPLIKKTVISQPGGCVRMLRAGRVDFVAATRLGMWWYVRTGTIEQSQLGEPFVLNRRPVYLLLSKVAATPARVTSLAEGVRTAKMDGSIARIVAKYGL